MGKWSGILFYASYRSDVCVKYEQTHGHVRICMYRVCALGGFT